jgi:hypothetical protein
MLINVPLEFKDVNGYKRICAKVYHNFNNQRCKVKFLTYYANWPALVDANKIPLRVDCPELCQVGLPTPLYGYNGNGILILLYAGSIYNTINTLEWEVDIVGDEIHFDIVPASMPAGVEQPWVNGDVFAHGQLMLDITPIL